MSDKAVEALLAYEQADEEGIEVLASRQAIHEVLDALNEAQSRLRHAEAALDLLAARVAELVEALKPFVDVANAYLDPGSTSIAALLNMRQSLNIDDFQHARKTLSGDGSTVLAVVDKATILTKTLLAIHEDARYHAVWVCANNHIGPYVGPTYTNEMAALVEALDQLQES